MWIKTNHIYFIGLVVLLGIFDVGTLKSQHNESGDTTKPYKNRLIPLPVAFYTPETKLAYGGIGIYLFKAGKDWHTRTSNFDFAIIHTTKNQLIIEPTYTIYTKGEKFYIRGTWILAWKISELFFEPSNHNDRSDGREIDFSNFKFNNRILMRIVPKLYAGIQQQYNNPHHIAIKDDWGGVKADKYFQVSSGVGPAIMYDTRDNILNPSKGTYLDVNATFFRDFFGSVCNFNNLFFDARFYKSWKWRGTWAVNTILNFNGGGMPPVTQLASLGGAAVLRGFYRGRFKDRNGFVIQTEYRQRIYKRFGMAAFLGIGEVAHKLENFDLKDMNCAYGLGIRWMIKKSERLNLRFDVGFGNHDSRGIYVGISETF